MFHSALQGKDSQRLLAVLNRKSIYKFDVLTFKLLFSIGPHLELKIVKYKDDTFILIVTVCKSEEKLQ